MWEVEAISDQQVCEFVRKIQGPIASRKGLSPDRLTPLTKNITDGQPAEVIDLLAFNSLY